MIKVDEKSALSGWRPAFKKINFSVFAPPTVWDDVVYWLWCHGKPTRSNLLSEACMSCSHWRAGVWNSSDSCLTTGSSSRSWAHRKPSGMLQESWGGFGMGVIPNHVPDLGCSPRWNPRSEPGPPCCHSNIAVPPHTWGCEWSSQATWGKHKSYATDLAPLLMPGILNHNIYARDLAPQHVHWKFKTNYLLEALNNAWLLKLAVSLVFFQTDVT